MKDPELCYAPRLVGIGVPFDRVAKLMGHADTNMVYARYARYAATQVLDDAINAVVIAPIVTSGFQLPVSQT